MSKKMADGLREDGETSLESLLVSRSVVPPGSPIKFTKSGKTVRIPVTRIRCGKWDFRAEERWLEYQPTSTGIVVVFRDRQHFDHEECVMFNLLDISAADLRVTAKFGSLDAMSAILTLECGKAIQITGSDHNLECTTHVMEITFHVNYTGQPLFNALFTVIKVPASIFRQIYDVFHSVGIVVYESLYSTQAAQLLRNCSQTMGEIIERSMRLDPLKAQLILMRSNVLNSGKALCHGFVYIYKSVERRVWYVFWRTTEEKED
ncbi:hypothetical protein AC249_AIPGENE23638 [Exaiptasia diaphana]|nr:hypothetical protein AC249_AIPGENE23638 [Exaiptasia diaphana]